MAVLINWTELAKKWKSLLDVKCQLQESFFTVTPPLMSACLFPVRVWKGKIVMSSEEYVSSITAAVAGSLCSQWLLMKSGGAWIRDGSEFLIMPPLVNWIFGGGGRRTGGEKNVIANLFSTALWTWCHSTKLITLRWLFVSNEILLKKCGCRIKKPRNVKSLHPGGGGR